jgi:hypothetical protein
VDVSVSSDAVNVSYKPDGQGPQSEPVGPENSDSNVGDCPFTLYAGWSDSGVSLSAPPPWINDTLPRESAGRSESTFSSERFATVQEAEAQLLGSLQQAAGRFVAEKYPEAAGWIPPQDLVRQVVNVSERCIEETELTVGGFTHPMYRVHWRVSMTDDTRQSLVHAWAPVVANRRIILVGVAVGAATGLLAVLNLLLRGLSTAFWQRWTRRKVATAAVVGGLLIAAVGLLG